jgi:hypothetical protein
MRRDTNCVYKSTKGLYLCKTEIDIEKEIFNETVKELDKTTLKVIKLIDRQISRSPRRRSTDRKSPLKRKSPSKSRSPKRKSPKVLEWRSRSTNVNYVQRSTQSILVRNFENSMYKKFNASEFPFTLSSYMQYPVKKTWSIFLSFIGQNINTTYIMCPTYNLKNGKMPDYQLGVTGKTSVGESVESGMRRELGEELGIIPLENGLQIYEDSGIININDTFINTQIVPKDNTMDSKNRICIIVYGSFEDMLNYCESYMIRFTDPVEHEALTMVSILPVPYVRDKLNSMLRRQR